MVPCIYPLFDFPSHYLTVRYFATQVFVTAVSAISSAHFSCIIIFGAVVSSSSLTFLRQMAVLSSTRYLPIWK